MSTIPVDHAAASTAAQSRTWAGDRLRLGQTNVGTWVVLALVLAAWQPFAPLDTFGAEAGRWATIVGVLVAIQLGFDLVGGYVLPVRYARRAADPVGWGRAWLGGTVMHGGAFFAIGVLAMAVGQLAGPWAAVGALAVVGSLLVGLQGRLTAWTLGGLSTPDAPLRDALNAAGLEPERVRVAQTAERSYAGGWVGPRGMETLIVAQRWVDTLGPAELHLALVRRRLGLSSGARAQGVVAALAFNVVGLGLVTALLPGAGFGSAGALLVTAAGTTLWGFLGLLTLPTVSRNAVYALDRAAATTIDGEDPSNGRTRMATLVRRLDVDQEDELQRSPAIETVYHPVPTPLNRAARLAAERSEDRQPRVVPWRVARMALFTSWASLSPLSRAVHCNIGRPELWALLPGD